MCKGTKGLGKESLEGEVSSRFFEMLIDEENDNEQV